MPPVLCRNMYVNGCHNANCSNTACGDKPRRSVMTSPTIRFNTNTTTFVMISNLTAGVMPPGPKE